MDAYENHTGGSLNKVLDYKKTHIIKINYQGYWLQPFWELALHYQPSKFTNGRALMKIAEQIAIGR